MAYERASIDDLYSLYLETGEPFNIGKDAARFVGKGAFAAVHSGLGPMKKIGSGFPSLDRKLAEGFIPNTVSVLFGRPSSGKSALRSNMAVNMCVAGMGVLVLSTETPVRSEMNRLLSIKTGYDYDVVSSWYELRGEDAERDAAIERAIREIDKVWHLYSAYDKMMSAHDVLNWLRKSKQQGPVNVVFIDRFDLLVEVSSCVNSAEKSAVIKKVLQTMSGLAESENVHVCCVAQQRRAQGSSSKKNAEEYGQGSIDSVGESRSYEEAADLMLSPHRPGKYDRDLPDNTMNITIGKQREGEAGAGAFVVLGWEGSTRRVYELTDDRGEN
jgi:replicative DNA helicase